jgi:ubiquinone biosynthesis protein
VSLSPLVDPTSSAPADLAEFAFINEAPWVLDPAAITWLAPVPDLRVERRATIPGLTRPSRLPPAARLLTVVGRLAAALGPWFVRRRLGRFGGLSTQEASRAELSLRLRRAAEQLGSTYIKLGQIISRW